MIRWTRFAGLCSLTVSCLAVVACDDSGDRIEGTGGTGVSEAGKATGGTGGKAAGGSDSGGSDSGGTFSQAGSGGTGAAAGAGGTAGSGGAPTCATNCNDNNPCTDDACEADVCVHRDNTADCDDNNACTSDDACSAGACKGTNNTAACDDANACTSNDTCAAGLCVGTNNTDACDDDNECTSNDVCTAGACQGTNNTADCDDSSSCTTGDQCWNGACRGALDAELCPSCDVPGNLIQNCDFSQGEEHWPEGFFDGGAGTQEVIGERLIVDITNGTNNAYAVQPRQEPLSLKQGMKYRLRLVAGASEPRSFVISLTLAAAPYTIFTPGDTTGGYTVEVTEQMKPFEFDFTVTEPDKDNVKLEIKLGGPDSTGTTVYLDDVYLVELACAADADCEDGNDCTTDTCAVDTGICSSAVRTGDCTDDGNECTDDVCAAGVCTHPNLTGEEDCTADADDCTADVCKAGVCTHEFDTNVCDCALDEHCDDEEACTADSCDNGTCVYAPVEAACDDGNVCTSNDACDAGSCAGADISVACDTDVCTIQNACSTGDQCAPGTNVCFDCNGNGNLLMNCDFATDLTGWATNIFFNGSAGTQVVENGMLKIETTNGGAEVWQVQPRQEGLVLTQGTTYVVRFNAYASVARPIIVTLTQNGGSFTSYSGPQTLNLTTEMQNLTFEFTMNAAAPAENVKFEFDMGGGAQNPTVPNTVYLDNLFIAPKP